MLRDAWALGGQFEKHLGCIDVAFHRHIEKHRTFAQQRGTVTNAPPRMVAYSVTALIGQLAHRRLITGDGVTAADVAVSFSLNGLRPRQS